MRIVQSMLSGLAGLVISFSVAAETVTLTSLEWPPYTGAELEDQGASVAVVRAAFEAMGHELKVEFYPWRRTVALAKEDPGYDGYFPEYYADSLKENFVLSDPIGTGPLGFAERADKPINWDSLQDLKAYTIGVVSGYVNTAEFDEMMSSGALNTSAVGDDTKNLLKVANGRVDLAVVDENVLGYLKRTDERLSEVGDKIKFNDKLLEDKELFVCFKKNDRGRKLAGILNEGLKKIDVEAIMNQHLQ